MNFKCILRWLLPAVSLVLVTDAVGKVEPIIVEDYKCSNGWTYSGCMVNGKRNGQGEAVTLKGNIYSGEWVNDHLPWGVMVNHSGNEKSEYEGAFNSNFSPSGYGKMHYTTGKYAGKTYIGNYVNGNKQGLGQLIDEDGNIEFFGQWRSGEPVKLKGQNFTPGEKVYGIDLSYHNPGIKWDQLALYCDADGDVYKLRPTTRKYMQPVGFVYIRATEGATVQDALYAEYSRQAERHFVPKGSYHLMCFTTSTVDEQIKNFLRVTNNCQNDQLPPVLDVENERQANLAGAARVQDMVDDMLKRIEKATGRRPVVYTNDKFARLYLDMSRLREYSIWKACYGRKSSQEKKKPLGRWGLWQFTEWGQCAGVSPIDINVYGGTRQEFNKYYIK